MNQELKKTIGAIKVAKGITQSEIATAIGVKPTYLSDMINERVPYSASMKNRIYEIYSDCLPAPTEPKTPGFWQRIIDNLLAQVCQKDEIIAERDKTIADLRQRIENMKYNE